MRHTVITSFGCQKLCLRFACEWSVSKMWPLPQWPAYKERAEQPAASQHFSRSGPNRHFVFSARTPPSWPRSSASSWSFPWGPFRQWVSPLHVALVWKCALNLLKPTETFENSCFRFSSGWLPQCECNCRWVKNLQLDGGNAFSGIGSDCYDLTLPADKPEDPYTSMVIENVNKNSSKADLWQCVICFKKCQIFL